MTPRVSHKDVHSNLSDAPAIWLAPRRGGPWPPAERRGQPAGRPGGRPPARPAPPEQTEGPAGTRAAAAGELAAGPRAGGGDRADAANAADAAAAEAAVTELYQAHALGLTRLAHVMLADRGAAEDVVQDAFYGLYRHYQRLADKRKALPYLRSSVLNGCRSELRRSRRRGTRLRDSQAEDPAGRTEPSAEAEVLAGEDRQAVLAAITRLPHRQRSVLVLRYYLDEPEAAIAEALGITGGTVRSTLHRALARLAAELQRTS
jgi:RNA polymerase sigma-70 factor (sigma-E family)